MTRQVPIQARRRAACYHAAMRSPRILTTLGIACSLTALGCIGWNPWLPDQAPPDPSTVEPSRAIRLQLPARETGGLDCAASQRCDQWFRVDVERSGVLRIEAGVDGLADGSIARLFLQDGTGQSLAKATSLDGLPLWVRANVEPGPYAVLLQSGGAAVSWSLSADYE